MRRRFALTLRSGDEVARKTDGTVLRVLRVYLEGGEPTIEAVDAAGALVQVSHREVR